MILGNLPDRLSAIWRLGEAAFLDFKDLMQFRAYKEAIAYPTSASGVLILDLTKANIFVVDHTENITTLTMSGMTTGAAYSFTLELKQDATGTRTLALPAAFKFPSTPSPSTTANKTNIYTGYTTDGGTAWTCNYWGNR